MLPFEALRVLDCSLGGAGPRASGFFADYGAEVTWIEPPGGDPARRLDPATTAVINRGKRSALLNVADRTDREYVLRLAERADVFIESWAPGVAKGLGFGFDDLKRRNPQLIYCSISGYGANDPRPDLPPHEPLVHARFGSMALQLGHREGPIFQALPLASCGAGLLAVIGILAALYRRLEDGVGRKVETSLVDGLLAFRSMGLTESDASLAAPGGRTQPVSTALTHQSTERMVTRSFLCSNGEYLGVHTLALGGFDRLMKVLGLDDRIPPVARGRDLETPLTREEADYLDAHVHRIFAERPRDEWVHRLIEADVCAIEHLPPTHVFDHRQVRHNGMVVTVEDPVLGPIEQVAPGLRFDGEAPQIRAPAPVAGEHTSEILTSLAAPAKPSPWRAKMPVRATPAPGAPLEGVRIADLGSFYAGPYASRLLADLGADVIKVESVAGDQMRGLETLFLSAQAGKRSLAINLKDPAVRPAVEKLVGWADIVHHNMRPGVAERLGLGLDQVRAGNPGAIYLFSPGWGSHGPDMMRQSFAPMLLNLSGASFEVAGQYNEPMPPAGNEDVANGLWGAIAMLTSLLVRRLTGRALACESPQLNAAMNMMAHIVRRPGGDAIGAGTLDVTQSGTGALDSLYQTLDGWLCLSARGDEEIAKLARLLDLPILSDPRFASPEARLASREELAQLLREAFAKRPGAYWLAQAAGTGLGLVEPTDSGFSHLFLNDARQHQMGRVVEVPHPQWGSVRELGRLLRISDAVFPPHGLAPALGEHTDQILTLWGYDRAAIDALRKAAAVR